MSSSQVRHTCRTAVVQMCVCVCVCEICCIVKGLESFTRTAVVQKCVICCVVKDHVLISSPSQELRMTYA